MYNSLKSLKRYVTDVSSFEGIDYSSQRFKVGPNRAIDANNFYYKDGVIQVREGIEELAKVEKDNFISIPFDENEELTEESYKTNESNFNGIWNIVGEDGKNHIIAHIGYLLYEIKNINTMKISITPLKLSNEEQFHNGKTYFKAYAFENYKSSAFVGANRLYFLGGNKYVCIRFLRDNIIRIFPVENHVGEKETTYIPTTTTSITYKNSSIGKRASLDKVNLMTQWRKNELLSGTTKNEDETTRTEFYDYTLDSPIFPKNEKDMSDILVTIEERGTIR